MSIYRQFAVKIHPDSLGSAVILADLLSLNDELQHETRAEVTAANTVPTHVSHVARKPMVSGATFALTQFLDNVGVFGLPIKSATNPGFVSYYQQFDDQGGAVSGSYQRSLTYGNGLLIPKTLRVDHQGDARLEFELHVIGDGTNAPVTISDTAALPSVSQAPGRWTLGPVTLGGASFSRYKSLELDFGLDVQVNGSQSALDPTYLEVRTASPKITLTGVDPAWFASGKVTAGGLVVANATDTIYLRKRSQDASHFVANATNGHIKIVPAGLAGVGKSAGAEMQRVSETAIVITCAKDGSGNAPIVITTDTTIT